MHLNAELNLFCAVDFPGSYASNPPHAKTVQGNSLSAFSALLHDHISKFLQNKERIWLSHFHLFEGSAHQIASESETVLLGSKWRNPTRKVELEEEERFLWLNFSGKSSGY